MGEPVLITISSFADMDGCRNSLPVLMLPVLMLRPLCAWCVSNLDAGVAQSGGNEQDYGC